VDLADAAALETLPAEVDVLVNNAGLQHVAPLHEFPPEMFALIQQVMVTAPFLLIRRTVPTCTPAGGGAS
jgi:3-hydroxybutyrate dehydrogenase